jgi:hypothetical protein
VGEEHLFEFETLQVADSESEEDDGVESNRVLNMPDKVNVTNKKSKSGASNRSSVQLSGTKRSIQDDMKQLSTRKKKIKIDSRVPPGVKMVGLDFRFPQKVQMTDSPENSEAHVVAIHPTSTCQGKIKLGDRLIAINGTAVNDPEDLERSNEKGEQVMTFTRVVDINSRFGYSSREPCNGICLANIENRKSSNIDKIQEGFRYLVACSLRYKASYIETHGTWNKGTDILGYLVDGKWSKKMKHDADNENARKREGVLSGFAWICRLSMNASGEEIYSFHRHDCIGGRVMGESGVCEICNGHIHKFYMACKAQSLKHSKPDNSGHTHIDQLTYESPYFLMELLRRQVREMKALRKKLWTYQQTCGPLKKEIQELKKTQRKERCCQGCWTCSH